jgi:RHS repeat-associated protein
MSAYTRSFAIWLLFALPAPSVIAAEAPPAVPQAVAALAHLQPRANDGPLSWTAGPYFYDAAGNIKNIGSETYAYDTLSRLRQATLRGPDMTTLQTQSFNYDEYGNLKSTSKLGQTVELRPDASTNRLQGMQYDAAGNLTDAGTQHYSYDAFGMPNTVHLGTATQPRIVYAYTADDERLFAYDLSTGTTHWTVRGLDNKVLRDFKQTGATWSVDRDYVYRDGLLLAALKPTGAVEHYTLDHLGTPRLVTDASGHTIGYHIYWPYGEEWSPGTAQEASPLKFTGHERDVDPTGGDAPLDYMHARYYNGRSARFSSVDLGDSVNPARPQSWNRYAYALNNPLNFYDDDGMVPKSVTFRLGRFSFHLDWTHSSRVPAPHFDVKVGKRAVGRFQIDKWAGEAGSKIPQSAVTALEDAAEQGTLNAPVMRALRQYAPKTIKIAGRAALVVGIVMAIADADDLNANNDRAAMAAVDQLARELFGKPISQLNPQELSKLYAIVQSGQAQPEQVPPTPKPCAPSQPTMGGVEGPGHPTAPNPPNC